MDCRNCPTQSRTPRRPTVCHLQARGGFGVSGKAWEARPSNGASPSRGWRSRGQEHHRPREDAGVPAQTERANSPRLRLFVPSGPRGPGCWPRTLGAVAFTQPPAPKLVPSRNTHPDTPRSHVLPAVCASCSPVEPTHKINPHQS